MLIRIPYYRKENEIRIVELKDKHPDYSYSETDMNNYIKGF